MESVGLHIKLLDERKKTFSFAIFLCVLSLVFSSFTNIPSLDSTTNISEIHKDTIYISGGVTLVNIDQKIEITAIISEKTKPLEEQSLANNTKSINNIGKAKTKSTSRVLASTFQAFKSANVFIRINSDQKFNTNQCKVGNSCISNSNTINKYGLASTFNAKISFFETKFRDDITNITTAYRSLDINNNSSRAPPYAISMV